ncbi:hypothetical protein BKP45_03135 [Anaerobacillus alkalidiazotrophicus]|uniref:DUF2922 domain-containing protein n=1 Tax=Anaerobacillus alkalidiazotrophicus TaxID=472963 RepID=A0A1S2MAI2_9BACI|nr:DUF2922 domain-containing protein [Anaerobacillus alkalidiazotrophicus]OIJ21708.1 hypothetical protein BKP45_03135 [Anaerobacillus alkalidiazotrophicus]
MAKKIELIFKNEMGRNVTVSLDNPIEPVDPTQVAQVMDAVIAEDAFISTGGKLVSKHTARIVERYVSDIEI